MSLVASLHTDVERLIFPRFLHLEALLLKNNKTPRASFNTELFQANFQISEQSSHGVYQRDFLSLREIPFRFSGSRVLTKILLNNVAGVLGEKSKRKYKCVPFLILHKKNIKPLSESDFSQTHARTGHKDSPPRGSAKEAEKSPLDELYVNEQATIKP